MQRLGYLKRLVKRVTTTSTSNLDNLGHDLLDVVTRKVRVPLDERLASYIKVRLSDSAYTTIKAASGRVAEKRRRAARCLDGIAGSLSCRSSDAVRCRQTGA